MDELTFIAGDLQDYVVGESDLDYDEKEKRIKVIGLKVEVVRRNDGGSSKCWYLSRIEFVLGTGWAIAST